MIVVLGLLVALGPLTIDMYLPALPRIASELGLSSSVAQLTLTGTLGGLALGQLIVGPLSDALGRRRPLIAGILLHMAASVLCLFAPNIEVLGVARALQGVGAAAASVVAIAVVSDLFEESVAAVVMSRLILVLGVAPVLAPSLGAAVLLRGSWHWVFAALAVTCELRADWKPPVEVYHDAVHWLGTAQDMYIHGLLTLALLMRVAMLAASTYTSSPRRSVRRPAAARRGAGPRPCLGGAGPRRRPRDPSPRTRARRGRGSRCRCSPIRAPCSRRARRAPSRDSRGSARRGAGRGTGARAAA